MGLVVYLDTILIPSSFFVTVGYHAYLWHSFKTKPSLTTFGINALKRRAWFLDIKDGDEKKGMLAVQSLRNTLMGTIFTASIAILVVLSLAALLNNAFNVAHLFGINPIFGSQSTKIFALKYGSAALFLSISFLFGSMAIGFLIDANFMVNNVSAELSSSFSSSVNTTETIFEKGFVLALVSNRMLCISFPLMLWMLGPLPVWLSTLALLWGLYQLDFVGRLNKHCNKQSL
ncbi:hypothetical protein PanWU01x14_151430 [Parasponia andersonii]|uniref:DUF599 domain-containing protein n=1 Tax=Parasponia andersonii TaxID=3476 RepID=A0A2P5CHM0_PARAD|nr:hypothetical protein PanWU01x14_151430 [Parasponia andersonii]